MQAIVPSAMNPSTRQQVKPTTCAARSRTLSLVYLFQSVVDWIYGYGAGMSNYGQGSSSVRWMRIMADGWLLMGPDRTNDRPGTVAAEGAICNQKWSIRNRRGLDLVLVASGPMELPRPSTKFLDTIQMFR